MAFADIRPSESSPRTQRLGAGRPLRAAHGASAPVGSRSPRRRSSIRRWLAGCRAIAIAIGFAAVSANAIAFLLPAATANAIPLATGPRLAGDAAQAAREDSDRSLRLVSLNPSLSAILDRLGAADQVVGVDDYTAEVVPALADRPRVGGLFDPNLEAVVALRPDRVLIVAGVDQEAHADRIRRVGVEVEVYANERFGEVLENIERLGRLVGRSEAAAERIAAIRATRRAVERATAEQPERPGTVAVVDRSPLFLVGGETFLDEMLEAAGADNLVRQLGPGYPRGSLEWLIAAKPSLLLDMTPGGEAAPAFWAQWPSLPAVRAGRVIGVEAGRVSLPGPDLDRALRELARLIHGPGIDAAIDRALARGAQQGVTDRAPDGAAEARDR